MKRIPTLLMIALTAALLLSSTHALMAQIPTLQADPDLVYVRITGIESSRNRPMRGLKAEQLKVFEDNTPQEIVYFSEDTLPLHMGTLLDVTDTTKDDMSRSLSTMTRSGAPGDEFFLLESGKASLNDAILQAIKELEFRGTQGKRALMLVTSRKDPGSYPLTMVRERLRELDILFYVTAHQTGSDVLGDADRQALKELAERTGGSAYFPRSTFDQADIFRKVVAQLKNQYVIGYRSSNRAMDGKWRKIKITGEYLDTDTKKIKKMDVLARPGYYAPKAVK